MKLERSTKIGCLTHMDRLIVLCLAQSNSLQSRSHISAQFEVIRAATGYGIFKLLLVALSGLQRRADAAGRDAHWTVQGLPQPTSRDTRTLTPSWCQTRTTRRLVIRGYSSEFED